MNNIPPHKYGPKSLLAFAVRLHMGDYRNEAARAKKDGRALVRRACTQMAVMLRANFRNARII